MVRSWNPIRSGRSAPMTIVSPSGVTTTSGRSAPRRVMKPGTPGVIASGLPAPGPGRCAASSRPAAPSTSQLHEEVGVDRADLHCALDLFALGGLRAARAPSARWSSTASPPAGRPGPSSRWEAGPENTSWRKSITGWSTRGLIASRKSSLTSSVPVADVVGLAESVSASGVPPGSSVPPQPARTASSATTASPLVRRTARRYGAAGHRVAAPLSCSGVIVRAMTPAATSRSGMWLWRL